jgi:hypothetical protein
VPISTNALRTAEKSMIASRKNLSDAPAFAKLVIVATTQRIRRGLYEKCRL